MFKKILYPTKFEEFALPILKSLTCLKAAELEEVIILNVIETESLFIIRDSGFPVDLDRIRDYAQKEIGGFAEYLKAGGIDVKSKIVQGTLVPEILKAADEEDVSLIVAGRQKRDVLGEIFVGSTTDRIIRKTAIPVLVAKYHVLIDRRVPRCLPVGECVPERSEGSPAEPVKRSLYSGKVPRACPWVSIRNGRRDV